MNQKLNTKIAAALIGLLGVSSTLQAESDPQDQIKYRQSVMKSIGGHMGAASMIMRGKVDYSEQLLEHARAMAGTMEQVKHIFPDGSEMGETAAKDEVWENPAGFELAADDASKAAMAFLKAVEAADTAEMGIRFKALGGSCKACHDDFRTEKE